MRLLLLLGLLILATITLGCTQPLTSKERSTVLEESDMMYKKVADDVIIHHITDYYPNIAKGARFFIREFYCHDESYNDAFTLIRVELPTNFKVRGFDYSLRSLSVSLNNGTHNYAILPLPIAAPFVDWISFSIWNSNGIKAWKVGEWELDLGWHYPWEVEGIDPNFNPKFEKPIELSLNPPYSMNTTKVYLHRGFVIVSLPPALAKKMTRVYIDGRTLFNGEDRGIVLVNSGWHNISVLSYDFIHEGNYTVYIINTLHNTTIIPIHVKVKPKYKF